MIRINNDANTEPTTTDRSGFQELLSPVAEYGEYRDYTMATLWYVTTCRITGIINIPNLIRRIRLQIWG